MALDINNYRKALQRRINLLIDALQRGVHTPEEFVRLCMLTEQEEREIWDFAEALPARDSVD